MIFEMNNARKDATLYSGKVTKTSPVVEVFSAMVNGQDLNKFGALADKAVAHIKELGAQAELGNMEAMVELNTIRRFVIEEPVMQEIKLLGIFGSYTAVGMDETIEREVWKHDGERSREQAAGGDVVYPFITKETYPVGTKTISGGYMVDYRRVAMGDMSKENEGIAQVKTDILNNAKKYIIAKVYDAIKNATGVKYQHEFTTGLTKAEFDALLNKVRRNGKPSIVGDYALLSQLAPFAGYAETLNTINIGRISEAAMEEIRQSGLLASYLGAAVVEMPNPYDEYKLTADGSNFETMLPAGLGFIIPTGAQSPIATYTRGGLTSFTGNDVKSGKIVTRFDLEVGCDVAKGQEHKIGAFLDTQLSTLA